MSETKTYFKNELKSAASLILTFSLPILHHYHNHQNAPGLHNLFQFSSGCERGQLLTRITLILTPPCENRKEQINPFAIEPQDDRLPATLPLINMMEFDRGARRGGSGKLTAGASNGDPCAEQWRGIRGKMPNIIIAIFFKCRYMSWLSLA